MCARVVVFLRAGGSNNGRDKFYWDFLRGDLILGMSCNLDQYLLLCGNITGMKRHA